MIVVDDNSQQSVTIDGAYVVRNPKRLGSSESRNVGSKYATRDWLLLVDDDLIPGPEFRSFIDELLPRLRLTDVVGFRITGYGTVGASKVSLYQDKLTSRIMNILFGVDISRRTGPSRFVPAAMIIRSDFFSLLGGFDPRTYGGNGFREESDLQWRARKKGGRLTYIHDPFFLHANVPGGHDKWRHSEDEVYYMRNQTIFALRSGSPTALVMIAAFGAYLLVRGFRMSTLVKGVALGIGEILQGRRPFESLDGSRSSDLES